MAEVRALEREAHSILSSHEATSSRVISLDQSYEKLAGLSLVQDELFRQALRCVEHGLYRASHVLAWAGFIDWLQHELMNNWFVELATKRPKWKIATVEDLQEQFPESQHIEACRAVGMFRKTVEKALQGLLNKRNECAHPSEYFPDLNETLGYISELFRRIESLRR